MEQNGLAYSIAVYDADFGIGEWSLYIDGNIQRLPAVNRLKVIVASCSSSFKTDKIQRDECIEKLRNWMMKAAYEDCLQHDTTVKYDFIRCRYNQ